MSNVYNPYIKKEKPTYTVPEYTPDNYFAQMDWNKEIANNKQGYMAVDIMSMKDFYDAGGYSFIDDYRAELTDIDAAYDRALPGYGVKGEQMAKAGLTGTGYSDYLGGQAYAGRVAGQALARQNAMANSNAFRAAYNQYVAQQKDKRAANLQTVVDRAISVNMNPNNFVTIATRLGIPQADAERGLEQLIAYYQGIGKIQTENADGSLSGSISGISGNTAPVWGNTNQYGVTDDQMSDVKSIQASLQGGLTGYTDNDGNVIVPQAPTLDAQIAALYGGTISKDDPRIQAAIKLAQESEVQGIIGTAQRGNFAEAKAKLDAWKDYGLFGEDGENSAVYQDALKQVQAETGKTIMTAVASGDLKSYQKALEQFGYEGELTEDNASQLLAEYADALHEEGAMSDEDYSKFYYNEYTEFIKTAESKREVDELATSLREDKKRLSKEDYSNLLGSLTISTGTKGLGSYKEKCLVLELPNGETFKYGLVPDGVDANDRILHKSTKGYKAGEYIAHEGHLFMFTGKENEWVRVRLSNASENLEAIVLEILQNKKSS